MVDYNTFKELVEENVKKFLPEKYREYEVVFGKTHKVNADLEYVMLNTKDDIKATVYLQPLYKEYCVSSDLIKVIENAAKMLLGNEEEKRKYTFESVINENTKENIIFTLVNTAANKELINNSPSRQWNDLSIIYRIAVGETATVVVDNRIADMLQLTEAELFKLAETNTERLTPVTIQSMEELMAEMFKDEEELQGVAEMLFAERDYQQTLWVISNTSKNYGAASIFYEDKLYELAEKVGSDLYILPSSIHEVIAVSCKMGDPNELAEMVEEINCTEVLLNERLSNQVYYYDKEMRKISLATDNPNKDVVHYPDYQGISKVNIMDVKPR